MSIARSHNLDDCPGDQRIAGFVIKDRDGRVYLRPTRGAGAGSLAIWTTAKRAQLQADHLNKFKTYGAEWVVVPATLVLEIG